MDTKEIEIKPTKQQLLEDERCKRAEMRREMLGIVILDGGLLRDPPVFQPLREDIRRCVRFVRILFSLQYSCLKTLWFRFWLR